MCKILAITGSIGRKTVAKSLAVANRCLRSERHGFGFLVTNGEESAFGRYLHPDGFGGFGAPLPEWLTGPRLEGGTIPKSSTVLLVHGRTSTNKICVQNVHPFCSNNEYLIHNGILDWVGPGPEPDSAHGCDSEAFLNWLQHVDSEQVADKYWAGYGAIFHYSAKGLKLIKCSNAKLYACKRAKAGWVFGTKSEDVETFVARTGLTVLNRPLPVPACVLRFDRSGEILEHKDFGGFGHRVFDALSYASLGYQIPKTRKRESKAALVSRSTLF